MKSCLLCARLGWNSSSNFPFLLWVYSLTDCLIVVLCPQGPDSLVTLCRYPFVFDAQAKTTLLQTDAVLQMQVRVNHLTVLLVSFSVSFILFGPRLLQMHSALSYFIDRWQWTKHRCRT